MTDQIIFDIETKPVPEKVRELYKFDRDSVKDKRIKDPAKLEAKKDEKEAEFYENKIAKAALNPLTCEVCAIGYYYPKDDEYIIDDSNDFNEAAILERFWDAFTESRMGTERLMIGWNTHEFDLPMIIIRSRILGVKIPAFVYETPMSRYFNGLFIDLMKVWVCNKFKEYEKLERVAKVLGVAQERKHNIEGKNFWKHLESDRENALQYLKDDLLECALIAEKIYC